MFLPTDCQRRDHFNGVPRPLNHYYGADGMRHEPRAQRGGNLSPVFYVGHWLRDQRLTFGKSAVQLAPAYYDQYAGSYPLHTDAEPYDVIIVGSGLAGLATAFFLRRQRPDLRLLLLDSNASFGGNAGRDDGAPLPVPASAAGAYAVAPQSDWLIDLYRTIGLDWQAQLVPAPFYNYFFDQHTPYAIPGARGWTLDVYGAGVGEMPYPAAIQAELRQARQHFIDWYNRPGAPTDPADDSDPRFDGLAQQSLHDYLTVSRGYHPAVSDFYTRFTVDALAGTAEQVSAYSAISFLGAEYHPIFSLPGGTSGIARHLLKWLLPDAIQGDTTAAWLANSIGCAALDRQGNGVRLRQNATALRVDEENDGATVLYFAQDRFYQAKARTVVLAGQSYTSRYLVDHLLDEPTRQAWQGFRFAPVVVANVILRRAAPLVDLGLGYNMYWWGSEHWADFVVADWVSPQRDDRERATVLTFYSGNTAPATEMQAERIKLLQTPFAAYEASLRADLTRILAQTDFDFDRDIGGVYLYRWGHGMVIPTPGFLFGPPQCHNGKVTRSPAARHLARQPLGPIHFAGQDVEGSPSLESAIGSGWRVAQTLLAML